MKKLLAVVLTLCMLLSCVAVGVSAASREVTKDVDTENHYWNFPSGSYYNPVEVGAQGSGFDVEMDIRFDDAAGQLENSSFGHLATAPVASLSAVGVGSDTVACSLTVNTWYHIKWDAEGGNTTVYIDGNEIGTVSGTATLYDGTQAFWAWRLISVDNLKVGSFFNDMENGGIGGQGNLVAEEVETYRADLGLKYWHFQTGNSFAAVELPELGGYQAKPAQGSSVEFDLNFDGAGSSIGHFGEGGGALGWAPMATPTQVGVRNALVTLDNPMVPGTWYHLKYVYADTTNDRTDIYIDGVFVGSVNMVSKMGDSHANIGDRTVPGFFWSTIQVSFDNLAVNGTVVEDFEDGDFQREMQNFGESMEYELINESIFDHFETKDPSGNALLITQDYDKTGSYYAISQMAPGAKDVIINFDLCLLPVKNDPVDSKDAYATKGAYYEFWLDSACQRRVQIAENYVGLQTSGNNDVQRYTWGEPSLDNWHNVTVVVKSSYNALQIYMDKELVFESPMGTPFDWSNQYLIGYTWNANSIIDNYATYDFKTYELLNDTMALDDNACCKWVDVDTDCSGWACGHIPGHTVRTTAQTCYNTGVDETTCAVCGELYKTTTVPMYAHKWESYNINNKTADGLVCVSCRNSGCPEKRYTALPENYTGTLYQYFDMRDDMALVANTDWSADAWTSGDGVLRHNGLGSNYNAFSLNQEINAKNFSVNLDIIYNGAVESGNSEQDRDYGHEFYFWTNGASTVKVIVGYSADQGKLFIRGTNTKLERDMGGDIPVLTKDFVMNEGEAYNFSYSYVQYEGEEDDFAGIYLYVNGNLMLEYSEDNYYGDAIFQLPYSTDTIHYWIFRDFATDVAIDNMAIASADFAYTDRVYNGDVDGDYALTTADAVLMRKLLAKVIDTAPCLSRADANLDGAVNAKDQLTIRLAIAE